MAIDKIDAGTPHTPAASDADASGLPPRAEVERSRISTQPPKRKLFEFLDEDEFDF